MFVTDSVKYIGVDDKDIDLFESQYVVPEGVSYNSYVIMDEKITVMDTVDARATEEWEEAAHYPKARGLLPVGPFYRRVCDTYDFPASQQIWERRAGNPYCPWQYSDRAYCN